MSSTGGGIVVHPAKSPGTQTGPAWFSPSDTQAMIDCLNANGQADLGARLQTILDASA